MKVSKLQKELHEAKRDYTLELQAKICHMEYKQLILGKLSTMKTPIGEFHGKVTTLEGELGSTPQLWERIDVLKREMAE
ncbi:hypothetical protein DM860_008326 [Cuscuta australis]|uniref:Uncharacterized protein n=1 Tax=Cuscuta australis TaxID=267555 RepID=A0A328D3V3_9ASTE|nr:hypothetical protein DM860_008326 [Cuscuta australis]